MNARKLTNCIIVAVVIWLRAWRIKPYIFVRRSFSTFAASCRTAAPSSPSDSAAWQSLEACRQRRVWARETCWCSSAQLSGVDRHPDQRRALSRSPPPCPPSFRFPLNPEQLAP